MKASYSKTLLAGCYLDAFLYCQSLVLFLSESTHSLSLSQFANLIWKGARYLALASFVSCCELPFGLRFRGGFSARSFTIIQALACVHFSPLSFSLFPFNLYFAFLSRYLHPPPALFACFFPALLVRRFCFFLARCQARPFSL